MEQHYGDEDMREFRREIREDIKGIFQAVEKVNTTIAGLVVNVSHKLDEGDVIKLVEQRLYRHKKDCLDTTLSQSTPGFRGTSSKETSEQFEIPWATLIKAGIAIGSAVAGYVIAMMND